MISRIQDVTDRYIEFRNTGNYIAGLVQDYGISNADAHEIP